MANILTIDNYNVEDALKIVGSFGVDQFGYLVTPNVDHVIRHHKDRQFRALYAQAAYVVLDSRFLANTMCLVKRQAFRVCSGSDLTAALFDSVVRPHDVLVLVGGTPAQAQTLKDRFGLRALHHIDPPMNLIRDPDAVDECLRQIEAVGPFRFCFLAIGSPQQEIIAEKLKARGVARGLALCVGASINYLTGVERRAPLWMQRAGFEWLYRLAQDPRRLAKRYLVRGPSIFWLLWRYELKVRQPLRLDGAGREGGEPVRKPAIAPSPDTYTA